MEQQPGQHFLLVTYAGQGHINPARDLARRLARFPNARVTFSTSVSGHRRMFPSASPPDQEVEDDGVTYAPFSDGYDQGVERVERDFNDYMYQFKVNGSQSLSSLVQGLAARGRPVTCIIYTMLPYWAADVARDLGIASALYWIQPSTIFAMYYHYFHGYEGLVTAHRDDPLFTVDLPGLPPFQIRDLPSFLTISTDHALYSIFVTLRETFETLDRVYAGRNPRVLVYSFEALEADALKAVEKMEQITIGPLLTSRSTATGGDLFQSEDNGYMEWLDTKPEGSVVYVAFGSLFNFEQQQLEEISRALSESGRPYLWVVRKDNRGEGFKLKDENLGMVVEWCSQLRVLSHPAVGCFVTHCGWNSTLESLACGVPIVCMPQFSDQRTNARLAETEWGTAVIGERNADGVLEAAELKRCLELVLGKGERAVEMRRRALMWKDKARVAVAEGGSTHRNLRLFVDEIGRESLSIPPLIKDALGGGEGMALHASN